MRMYEPSFEALEWETFVRRCASALSSGLSNRGCAVDFAGKRVRWSGTIGTLDLSDQAMIKGIAMEMPRVDVPLYDGRAFIGSYLFLRLSAHHIVRPRRKKVGDSVTFTGCFSTQSVFPSFSFDADDEQRRVFLSMLLEEGSLE